MSTGTRASRKDRIPRLWLFDFDNTIARLEPEVDWAAGRLKLEPYLRSVGAPPDIFEKIPRGNLPLYDEYRKRLLDGRKPGAIVTESLRRASNMIEEIEMAGVDRAKELEGAIETLTTLKRNGASIAIVTSNSSRTVERWFQMNRCASCTIVGRDTFLALKPSPAMLLRALELFSAKPADAVFVGDSEADLLASRAAGVKFYAIGCADRVRDRLLALGAEQIFASPAALAIHLNLAQSRA